jgi:hypothetical protein
MPNSRGAGVGRAAQHSRNTPHMHASLAEFNLYYNLYYMNSGFGMFPYKLPILVPENIIVSVLHLTSSRGMPKFAVHTARYLVLLF